MRAKLGVVWRKLNLLMRFVMTLRPLNSETKFSPSDSIKVMTMTIYQNTFRSVQLWKVEVLKISGID
jgi:ATP adenylyltransferase/5',5'''-P-1,P-4-tetraphosphate phosphorylase II